MQEQTKSVKQTRKNMYYAGIALIVFGGLLVLSVLFSFIAIFARLETAINPFTAIIRALVAMMTIGAGQVMLKVGKGELTGADLEPEGVKQAQTGPEDSTEVRCLQCQAMNQAQAPVCQSCGSTLDKVS